MSKLAPTTAAALLLTLLFLAPSTRAGSDLDKELPAQEGLVRYGCTVQGPLDVLDYHNPDGRRSHVWMTTFWAEHDGPAKAEAARDWKLLYSYRKKRKRALGDCDKFLERVRKAHAAHRAARRSSPKPPKPEEGTSTASLAAAGAPLRPQP